MSQPMEDVAASDAPTRDEEQPEPLSFTLLIVSPSVGVSSPLSFPHLPATTTVKQLKARIRDALPSKPVDESQRLIHRGRMLGRDSETMLDIFGQETVRDNLFTSLEALLICYQLGNPESQTLHLVLRPSEGAPAPPSTSAPTARPQSIPPNPSLPLPQQRPQSTPAIPAQGMHAQQPLPGFQHVQQHQVLHQAEHYHNMMAQRLQQLQRETQRLQQEMGSIEQRYRAQANMTPGVHNPQPGNPNPLVGPGGLFQLPHLAMRPPPGIPPSVQNFIAQQQRDRAAEGRNGAQDSGNVTPGARSSSSGRASPNVHRPDHTTTYTREGIGPNGERWQMTVNETTTTLPLPQTHLQGQPPPHHHHHVAHQMNANPALDIQAVLRNADRFLATQNNQAAQNNMQRSASTPHHTSAREAGTTRTVPQSVIPSSTANAPSTSGSPSISVLNNPALNAQTPNASVAPGPETMVYVLSSPQGPRALLVSNSQTFFTPRQHSGRRRRHDSPAPAAVQNPAGGAIGLPEYRNRPAERAARRNVNEMDQVQVGAPHANPGAGALAAQIGPMLWLVFRLIVVVYLMTSGNTSWTRWFMVAGAAFLIFIVKLGIFNGIAEQVWGPIRRHLEALIPLAGPDAALIPAINAAAIPQQPPPGEATPLPAGNGQPRAEGEPDPAQAAARLVERRRQANGGWLRARIRRAEHALLLFMASLVPGVGERHIAAREAEANAAQRLLDEAAAAAAAENQEGDAEQESGQRAEEETAQQDEQGQAPIENDRMVPAPAQVEV
ncbi:hypothetical protein G7Y89_g6329 [Cudoniella acicularis]|uniref:Ubiquitin-like domain-containing protein n=1 Tax=Cudoniella acicularis TaxID=354080 RepID=A0A8H4RMG2_9HELO|nr:hypothetical protein G7Y89_g6329 [Cudoniella acicularis]